MTAESSMGPIGQAELVGEMLDAPPALLGGAAGALSSGGS